MTQTGEGAPENREEGAGGGGPGLPWHREVLRWLASSEADSGSRERAREELLRRAPLGDLDLDAAKAVAAACESAGLAALAVLARRRQVALAPGDDSARLALSELLLEGGEPDEAIEQLRQCRGLRPDDDPARSEPDPRAAAILYRLYVDTGAMESAEELLGRMRRMMAPELLALADRLESEGRDSGQEGWLAIGDNAPTEDQGEDDGLPELGSKTGPKDSDLIRMMRLFSGREGIYARQWWNEGGQGGYSPVKEPLTPRVLQNHLYGNITVGVYPVRQDGTALFFALDLDISKRAMERVRSHPREARDLREAVHLNSLRIASFLRESGIEPLLEDSGYKGRHLWVFLRQPETSDVLYRLGVGLLQILSPEEPGLHLEFFPKQPRVSPTGIGNLIKLPLGIHRRTGRRSVLLDADGAPFRDPYAALRQAALIDRARLYDLIDRAKRTLAGTNQAGSRGLTGSRGAASAGQVREVDGGPAPWEVEAPPEDADLDRPEEAVPVGPEPPEPPPAWTEADFERDAEVCHLFRMCGVLTALREQVNATRRLDHDERVVLTHVLGHRPSGVLAANYLLDRCVNVPETEKLQSPFSGNPISCPKIRKRIPRVTAGVDCSCDFSFAEDHYPTPLLHLRTMPDRPSETAIPQESMIELGRRLAVLEERAQRLAREAGELRQALAERMIGKGIERLQYPEGAFLLRLLEGAPAVLEWVPDPGDGQDTTASDPRTST